MSNKKELFVYEWVLDPDQDVTNIRIYGISPGSDGVNRNVCLRIENFKPYAYIQLPDGSDDTSRAVIDCLQRMDSPPIRVDVLKKHHLYNFQNRKSATGKTKKSPFMFTAFESKKKLQDMVYHLKNGITLNGCLTMLKVHETSASPILQMVSIRDIPTSGWVDFSLDCPAPVAEEDKMTVCDDEYIIKWRHLNRSDRIDQITPKCMAFDMEVNSDFMNQMPSDKPGDCIFQISCVITEKDKNRRKVLFSLKAKDMDLSQSELLEGVEVRVYEHERELLLDFMGFIADEKPNALTGFNIFGFDIEYAMKRACRFFIADEFKLIGFNKLIPARIEEVRWTSSAYKNQVFKFINWEGILLLDLLPIIKRDYKLDTYTLKNVTATFLNNNTKDPVTYKDIFIACRTREKMDVVGKYCIQDSDLCIELMNHLHTWVALSEMSKVCNVSMFTLYTQGQQIKLYSQVYKYCLKENIVVDSDGYEAKSNERYRGAHVIEPVPGFYKRVVPLDFSSLYPSLIIAYNICYSTITDETTPDDQCNIFDWEDHVGCEHDPKVIKINKLTEKIDKIGTELSVLRGKRDAIKATTISKGTTTVKEEKAKIQCKIDARVLDQKPFREQRQELKKNKLADREDDDGNKISGVVCAKRYYRFLKPEVKKGVIPTIIQDLLDSRKRVKGLMKKCSDASQKIVYDKEQLAHKVSANSMYGAMGVKRGYLPFMPGAMCVTYAGRTALEKTAELIQTKFGGTIVYGDTDCLVGSTPVLLQHINDENKISITYKAIEEISNDDWYFINDNKEKATVKPGYKIWSDEGFTNIDCIVRCGIQKPLTRVVTHVGEVTCSNEHSLLTENLQNVTPLEVEIGDKLCTAEFPLPDDTPPSPIYTRLDMDTITKHELSERAELSDDISAHIAFVWGMFYADGSCGGYKTKNTDIKHSWAINNQNRDLLMKCVDILNAKYADKFEFKILETMKSSSVYKLVPKKLRKKNDYIKDFVTQYRDLFYTSRREKKLPTIIFNASLEIRHAFFLGYWAGDGAKNDCLTLSNKGSVGSAGLFFLARSLGYKVSINTRSDKPNVYKLILSTPDLKFRKTPNAIKKKIDITNTKEKYIYDIQTENHHFAAGVGQLVVHNSNYVKFNHLNSVQETWDYALKVAEGVTNWIEDGKRVFPKPINLEFENTIYERFLILSKKRYMFQEVDRDGTLNQKVGKKGVILARRDNSQLVRSVYEQVTAMIFENKTKEELYEHMETYIQKVYNNEIDLKNYIITKSVGDSEGDIDECSRVGDYKVKALPDDLAERKKVLNGRDPKDYYISCCPAQVQLADRMKRRGVPVDAGSRIEYVVTKKPRVVALGQRIEDYDYFKRHSDVLKIDSKYYVEAMVNPLDQIFKTMGYGDMMKQFSLKWDKISKEREEMTKPIFKLKKVSSDICQRRGS